jgi:hypothetical protein
MRDQPKVADGASELLQDVFAKGQEPLPPGLWRRKPSTLHACRAGLNFRSYKMREEERRN